MVPIDAIVLLIDAAKRLRVIAEETGSVELKARILDILVQLQEIREQAVRDELHTADTVTALAASEETSVQISAAAPPHGLADGRPARLEPSGDTETYALVQEPEPEASAEDAAPQETSDDRTAVQVSKQARKAKPAGAKTAQGAAGGSSKATDARQPERELSDQERFALAEQRIADLEPMHQAALKKMNDVLTPEQATKKSAATKKGLATGLKGKELQDAVFNALDLTDEQQQTIAEGKRELHQVRLAIAKQVEGLLSRDQLDRLLRSHRH